MDINYIINFFLIVFSGFYLASVLSISPIYISTIISLILIIINVMYRKKFFFNGITIIAILLMIYILIIGYKNNINFNRSFSYIFNYIYIILLQQSIFLISDLQLKKIISLFYKFNIILLTIEILTRISSTNIVDFRRFGTNKSLYYYAFKFNSIMYMDTNFVGVYILIILMLGVYLNLEKNKILKTFLCFTFCKAAICVYFFKNIKKYKKIGIIIFIFLIILIIKNPETLLVRFLIVEKTIDYLKSADMHSIIFGLGMGNSISAIGMGGHNLFITNLLELGIIGSLFNFFLWYLFYKQSKKILIIAIPFILVGLAFAPTSIPYIYTCFFIIIKLENGKDGGIKNGRNNIKHNNSYL